MHVARQNYACARSGQIKHRLALSRGKLPFKLFAQTLDGDIFWDALYFLLPSDWLCYLYLLIDRYVKQ